MNTPAFGKLVGCAVLILGLAADPRPAPAADAPRPNVLFAIADDWGRHAGAYGTKWVRTPGFDRVAREGLLFEQAYTPNAKCAPSRAILLTGRQSWQLEDAGNHMAYFPAKFRTFPEAMAGHGYFVGTTGKGWGPGVANGADGKPRAICGTQFNRRRVKPPAAAMAANDYAANFVDFLDAAPQGKPWCFWYGSNEPHRAFEPGVGATKGGKRPSDIDRVPAYLPDTEAVRQDMLDYAYEVEHADRHLVRMLDELARRGLAEDTLVVVTSDHGMPFPRAKGQAYPASNRVPLAVRWPAGIRQPGRAVDEFVDFTDLAPTLLDLAELDWEGAGMAPAAGRSWREIFQGHGGTARTVPPREHVLVGKERHDVGRPNDAGYPIRGMVKDGFLYLQNFEPTRWPACNPETGYLNCDASPTKSLVLAARRQNPADPFWALCFGRRPAEELYDLARDPDCVRNLAADPEHRDRRTRMQREMTDALKAQGDPRMSGNGDVFDRYPIANEEVRNFYERHQRGEKVKAGWVNEDDFEKGPLP